ncbi:hypothetical protein Y032_0073g745 [Ancylostoma ceylanicum]|uniref:Uncharacterized protein n=1 Tax=Ancylostoma ceylanicum TaxID=53326 RepID=A0A016TUZ8_9BILA|nr:hypothetical protein Y032_0073g745 [Ancylostoma ceylanicum]
MYIYYRRRLERRCCSPLSADAGFQQVVPAGAGIGAEGADGAAKPAVRAYGARLMQIFLHLVFFSHCHVETDVYISRQTALETWSCFRCSGDQKHAMGLVWSTETWLKPWPSVTSGQARYVGCGRVPARCGLVDRCCHDRLARRMQALEAHTRLEK